MIARIRAEVKARELRAELFGPDLFIEPAWNMMLHLLTSAAKGRRVPVSDLCQRSGAAYTTALRVIERLREAELVERQRDLDDGRRVFVSLTERARGLLERYFAATPLIRQPPTPPPDPSSATAIS